MNQIEPEMNRTPVSGVGRTVESIPEPDRNDPGSAPGGAHRAEFLVPVSPALATG
jgi:hypothetical protein